MESVDGHYLFRYALSGYKRVTGEEVSGGQYLLKEEIDGVEN